MSEFDEFAKADSAAALAKKIMDDHSVDEMMRCIGISDECYDELRSAMKTFPRMASPHEGWAILKEEVDELWNEVKRQHDADGRDAAMYTEAMQVAAMAMRFMYDCCTANRKISTGGAGDIVTRERPNG
jgi:hypothetical protein